MELGRVATTGAPAAIAPYSQAVKAGGFLWLSGQIGMDPHQNDDLVAGGATAESSQIFKNMEAVLREAGCKATDVCKVTVFITDMKDYAAVNKIYAAYFGDWKPARSAVQVAKLPKGAVVEVEAVALLPNSSKL